MELLLARRAAPVDPKAEDGEGVELTLGLAIGGSTRKAPEPSRGGIFGLPDGASAEDRAAMDAQMLRSRARDRAVREDEALSGDRSRPTRTDGGNGVRWPRVAPLATPSPHPNPFGCGQRHPFPVMYPHQQVQYVPVPNGFGLPYVMPCWAPTISAVAGGLNRLERKVYPPLSGRGFPVQGPAAGPCDDGGSSGSKGIEAAKVVNTSLNSDSSGSTSSAISDRRSGSVGGGSISSGDSRNHRSRQKAPPSAEGGSGNNAQTSCLTSNAKPARFGAQLPERAGSVTKSGKPPALPRLPLVSATGDAPHGRTIHGLLYRCTKSEVRMLCVCHGNSFTPAEFLRHAGGADVSQPLKRIVVVQPGW
ncbi:hypothetical protein MUK42_26269 [Musa troglodytarum]|uniref:Ninja-family protein n=1 Tax=Musa troglodytarum TaxID=320322 RepID=A0A9E7L6P4_9LILI|nr:hypothetical protein MUK42_26269 [Musa troglodytarum]